MAQGDKTLSKFTTSKGNEIEIYTTLILDQSNSCMVFDRSCQLERRYTIGKPAYLSWDQHENGYENVTSFEDVIQAWKTEAIHF